MKPTLFLLAAGMGSRYGGLKQLDGLGVSPGASGMQPRDPCRPWRGTLASGHKPR